MSYIVVAFGLLILALAAIGIASPRAVIGTMLAWKPQTLLAVA